MKAAFTLALAALLASPAAPALAEEVDADSVPNHFVVEATDEKPGTSSGAHDATNSADPAPPTPPLCTESGPGEECQPVTTCEADPLSPTGYTGVTEYGIQSDGLAEPISVGPCTPDEPKAGQPSLPAQVLRAFKRVPLPEPHLSIQPPNGKTLVGLETIFSTEAEPFTKTLKLLGKGVTLSITPAEFTWRHGDDTEQSTDWPGKPWEQGSDIDDYITHVYEHTGTTKPSVQITWEAEYRVGNGPWQPVNGTVTRTSPASTLSIREGTPELVAP